MKKSYGHSPPSGYTISAGAVICETWAIIINGKPSGSSGRLRNRNYKLSESLILYILSGLTSTVFTGTNIIPKKQFRALGPKSAPLHPHTLIIVDTVYTIRYCYINNIIICTSAVAVAAEAEINGTCAAETAREEHVRTTTAGNTESVVAAKPLQKARGSTRLPPQTTTTNAERRQPLSLTQLRRSRRRAALALIYQRRIIAAAAAARSLFILATHARFLFTAAACTGHVMILYTHIQDDSPGAYICILESPAVTYTFSYFRFLSRFRRT